MDKSYDFDDFVNRYTTLCRTVLKLYHIIYKSHYDNTPLDVTNPLYITWFDTSVETELNTINSYVRELTGDNSMNYVEYGDDERTLVFTYEKRSHLYHLLIANYGNLFRQVMKTKDECDDDNLNLLLLKIVNDTIRGEYNIENADMSGVIMDTNIDKYGLEVANSWVNGAKHYYLNLLPKSSKIID
jgi:hypothetical protein